VKRARYVGWRGDLKGTTALLRDAPHLGRHGESRVFIQLDQRFLDHPCAACYGQGYLGGEVKVECGACEGEGKSPQPLAYGWHDFAADQWEVIE